MYKKSLILVFLVFAFSSFTMAQDHLLEGTWELLPEQSSHIDLFGQLTLKIDVEKDHINIVRIWGLGSRSYSDSIDLDIKKRKQTEIISTRVFPTNVFMGMKVAAGEKREYQLEWNPKEVKLVINESFPGLISQGEKDFTVRHVIELEPLRNILSYEIQRSTRTDSPIKYLFKKEGDYDAYVHTFDSDWDVRGGLAEKAAFISLQGIVNKSKPNLYFVYPDSWDFRFTPNVKDFLKTYHYFTFKEAPGLEEVLKAFKNDIKGYIIWDKDVRTSLIVGFTLAGLKDAIVVDESLIPWMDKFDIPRVEDFRGTFKGMNDYQIYSWAKDKYWSACSREYIVWMGGDAGAKMRPGVADWGIRNQSFFSDLSSKVSDTLEYRLADQLLGEMNDMAMVFGWHSYGKDKERDHVTLTSQHGLRVEGLHTLPNMSFMSHIKATPGFEYKNNHSVEPGKRYIPEKRVYISCVQTDCLGLGAWTRPGRGTIPYAWEVTMNWLWLAPAMMEYFYSEATPNDYFIGSLSGPGYMYPKAIPEEKMPGLLTEARELMDKLDLNIFEVMDYSEGATIEGNTEIPKSIVRAYSKYMPDALGFINGYAPSFTFGEASKKPFISFDYYLSPDRPADEAAADIKELATWNQTRPYYLLVHVRQWSDITRVQSVLDQLGSEFQLIPLDLLMMYVKENNTFTERYLEK